MSDVVIRLGGSSVSPQSSLYNFQKWTEQYSGRCWVVVSAIPALSTLIKEGLDTVFRPNFRAADLQVQLESFWPETILPIAADYRQLCEQLVALLNGIRLIGDYSIALKDQVLSFAERLTVSILQGLWKGAEVLLPETIQLTATPDYGAATFIGLDRDVLQNLTSGIYLLPGSYGITAENKIARCGSTAADYTAAFVAAQLQVETLKLWGLDEDFRRADPLVIPEAERLDRLTYAEAGELAYFEHFSFHPRTVEPLEHLHIPIEVLASDSPEGRVQTVINTETVVDDRVVKCIACTDDISLLALNGPGVGLKPGILARVTGVLHEAGVNIKSVITAQTAINVLLDDKSAEKAYQLVKDLGFSSVTELSVDSDVALLGVVGHGMQNAPGVSARIFAAVANNHINVLLSGSGASDLVSYLLVRKADKQRSVKALYQAFFKK